LGVISVGLLMRFRAPRGPASRDPHTAEPGLLRALAALRAARQRDGRPLGELFGDAVRNSMNTLLFVGGAIVMFSVVLVVLSIAGGVALASALLAAARDTLGVRPTVAEARIRGGIESTSGAEAARLAAAPLLDNVVAASDAIAWSGLSVHAQVAVM